MISNLFRSPSEQSKEVEKVFADVEWITIFFFIGLFIVVYGVEETGLLKTVTQQVVTWTGGYAGKTAMAILWVSALVSALVDNIPLLPP